MATLVLLVVGESEIFPQLTTHRIPNGVIENRKATNEEKISNKRIAKEYASAAYGWTGKEWECLLALWTAESRFDNYARPLDEKGKPRSSAFGIAQLLGEQDPRPEYQILRGLKYISKRHSTPCKAYRFHLRNQHY